MVAISNENMAKAFFIKHLVYYLHIQDFSSNLQVNIVNVLSLEVKYYPCLMIVAVNWSEAVKFAN